MMNWRFWEPGKQPSSDSCEVVAPMLSLYADQMASRSEASRVESHMAECRSCRDNYQWMQATRTALSARPAAVPPPDLRARVARAIAAQTLAPSFVTLRPVRRSFVLRPAFAAALSVALFGAVALTYSTLTSRLAPVAPTPRVASAGLPTHHTATQHVAAQVKPHHHTVLAAPIAKLAPVFIEASNLPKPKPITAHITRMAKITPVPKILPAILKVPAKITLRQTLMAKLPSPPVPVQHPAAIKPIEAVPQVSLPAPEPVALSPSPPAVRTADNIVPPAKHSSESDILADVKEHVSQLNSAAYTSKAGAVRNSLHMAAFIASDFSKADIVHSKNF